MRLLHTSRSVIAAGAMVAAIAGLGSAAIAQDKAELRFSAVFSEQDIRAKMAELLGQAVEQIQAGK